MAFWRCLLGMNACFESVHNDIVMMIIYHCTTSCVCGRLRVLSVRVLPAAESGRLIATKARFK
eukprot:5443315-Amphidinium_carterae.1